MDLSGIGTAGWRQGKFLPAKAIDTLADRDGRKGDVVIIVSQDCDLVHKSNEVEPVAEAIWGSFHDKPDRKTNSSRFVDLTVEVNGSHKCVRCWARDRVSFPRELLIKYNPDATMSLSLSERERLVRMIIRRYRRLALPDTFNNRLKPIGNELKKLLRNVSDDVSAVYIRVSPQDQELPEGEKYKMSILLLQPVVKYDSDQSRDRVEDAGEHIAKLIAANCGQGIDLGPAESLDVYQSSENAFTVAEHRTWLIWDSWDHLSPEDDDDRPPDPV